MSLVGLPCNRARPPPACGTAALAPRSPATFGPTGKDAEAHQYPGHLAGGGSWAQKNWLAYPTQFRGNHTTFACRETVTTRVNQTGGNRSNLTGYRPNRFGLVSVWAGTKSVQIQNLNLNLKNEKFLKILQGATNLMVSNFLKNSSI